jgi:hypothetical protein
VGARWHSGGARPRPLGRARSAADGAGLVKRRGRYAEFSPGLAAMRRAVNAAPDPAGVFSPGTVPAPASLPR